MTTQDEYQYPDGSTYSGQWDSVGQRQGKGLLNFSDGARYQGGFEGGYYSGLGVITYADGTRYCGEFHQGKFNGYGVFVKSDGMMYEGEFAAGLMKGLGCITFPDGTHGLPRNEGHFDGDRLRQQERCSRSIHRARDAARRAMETNRSSAL